MLKRLSGFFVLGLLLLGSLSSFAQNENTSSPYSRFGLGDIHPYSFGRFAAMGGASIGSRHNVQINTSNPASYSSIDSLTFIFEFGLDGRFSDFKSGDTEFASNDVNFRYFALSWPITRWVATSMGVLPYADKGYEILYEEDDPGFGRATYRYAGSGTITKAFFGAGFDITKSISLGINIYYLFGKQSNNSLIFFLDDNEAYDYSEIERSRLRDFAYQLGVQYDIPLKDNRFLTIGGTFEHKPEFTAFQDFSRLNILQTGGGPLIDTLEFRSEEKGTIQLPTTYSLGVSYAKPNKFEINADLYFAKWSKARFFGESFNTLLNPDGRTGINSVNAVNQSRFSIGGEYIPEAASIRSYFKKVKYRAGLHYEKSYLKIGNQQINEFGMSFGLGLPVNRSKSTINLAVELGRKGTTNNNLIRENYTKVSLSLNLYDRWFFQRKFD